MDVIVLESEAFRELLKQQKEMLKQAIRQSANVVDNEQWINEGEAMELLGIKSKSTLQRYRDLRLIRYSQHGFGNGGGRTIKYDRSSILDYLNRNAVEPLV